RGRWGKGDARRAVEARHLAKQAIERHGGVSHPHHGCNQHGAPEGDGAVPVWWNAAVRFVLHAGHTLLLQDSPAELSASCPKSSGPKSSGPKSAAVLWLSRAPVSRPSLVPVSGTCLRPRLLERPIENVAAKPHERGDVEQHHQ